MMHIDYAHPKAQNTWGTVTAKGETCFTRLRTRREAVRLALEWSREFPEAAPYAVKRQPGGDTFIPKGV